MFRALLALALTAAVGALLAVAPGAEAYVWYVDFHDGNKLGRANDDGTGANDSFLTSGSTTVGAASNGSHVFWGRPGAIGRASTTGNGSDANPTFVTTGSPCGTFAVAANATHVYWIVSNCQSQRYIGTYALDGSDHEVALITGGVDVCGIALDQTYIYWSNGRHIGRALLNGTSQEPTWRDLGAGKQACGVAVDSDYVYWTVRSTAQDYTSTIGRASKTNNASPGVNNSFITGARIGNDVSLPSSLVVDGTYVYWTHQVPGQPGGIGRGPKTGGAGNGSFITPIGFPVGVAIDAIGTGGGDSDGDGVGDGTDNCPSNANAGQEDIDRDGQGDVCDPDDDNDGHADASDNCPTEANPSQADSDGDGAADACDPDDDNDGVTDGIDNCPTVANADQVDSDGDRVGRACDDNDTPPVLPPPPPPLVAGVITSNSSFAPGPSNTAVFGVTTAARVPRGTVFSFNLDRAATVRIVIQRRTTGRRVKGRCRKTTNSNRRRRRCPLWVNFPRHTLTRTAHAGRNKVEYTGRVRNKTLTPGRYRAQFTAVDGELRSRPVVVTFRVVRP